MGLEPYSGAYLNITAEVRNHGHSNVGAIDERVINPANLATYPGSNMTELSSYPSLNMIEGDAETHLKLLSINAGFSFERGTELYGCMTYGRKEATSYSENYQAADQGPVHRSGNRRHELSFSIRFQLSRRDRRMRIISSHGGLEGLVGRVGMGFVEYIWRGQDSALFTLDSANAGLFALTGTPTPSASELL